MFFFSSSKASVHPDTGRIIPVFFRPPGELPSEKLITETSAGNGR